VHGGSGPGAEDEAVQGADGAVGCEVTRRGEMLGVVVTVVAVAGVLLNNGRIAWCFPLWMASNGISLGLHVRARMWSLAVRDGIFLALAAAGWWQWTR